MKLEQIVIRSEYTNWRGNKDYSYSNYYFITKKEVEDLRTWLVASQVQFSGFQGKVYFHKDTEFPRYKFTEYSKQNNQIVRRVKDIKNCDVVVLDIMAYEQVLKDLLKQYTNEVEIYPVGVTDSDGYDIYERGKKSNSVSGLCLNNYNNSIPILEILIDLYNTNTQLKSVSVYDLTDVITKTANPIDGDMAANLKNLLASNDDQSIKLAMEVMTNADFESSLFHLVLLCSLYGDKIIYNQYYNSVAFKSFRNNLQRLGLNIEYLRGNDTSSAVQKFLSLGNKSIFEEDVDFIKKCIKDEVDEAYNMSNTGFELVNYEIKLNLDPNKIISKNNKSSEDEKVPQELTIN